MLDKLPEVAISYRSQVFARENTAVESRPNYITLVFCLFAPSCPFVLAPPLIETLYIYTGGERGGANFKKVKVRSE